MGERPEDAYVQSLKDITQVNKAFSVPMALGSLIIKERLKWSNEETVEQIKETPYLQYFIGLSAFQEKAPFHASLMTHFRKRLDASIINQVNEWVVEAQMQKAGDAQTEQDDDDDDNDSYGDMTADAASCQQEDRPDKPSNQGKLLIDAREKLERIIDTLHEPYQGEQPKPRTYRKKARKAYLSVAKQRNPRRKTLRKAIGKQLNFVKRDLKHIEALVDQGGLKPLSKSQYRHLFVIQELYRQQQIMYETKTHQVEDRIVSIGQPHLRPIVRGKAGANVEFGAKLSVSMVNGFAFLDKLNWDAYHEGKYLIESIEAYHNRYGVLSGSCTRWPNLPDTRESGFL